MQLDPTRKPPEMYALIESFCLGARRLEIFGRRRAAHPLRRGWVTVLLDDDGDMNAVDRVEPDEKEVDSRASSVAGNDEEEAAMKTDDDLAKEAVEQTNVLEGLKGAVLWEKEKWEKEVREACQAPVGARVVVVPSTTGKRNFKLASAEFVAEHWQTCSFLEIDLLRPKSPTRGTSNNNTTAMSMSMAGQAFPTGLGPMGNMGIVRPVPMQIQPGFRGPIMPHSVSQGPYPMMSPPMRIGHGVMNPGLLPNQMAMSMGASNPAMNMAMTGMMVPQMGQMGQMGNMGMLPHMGGGMGMGMGMNVNVGGGMGGMGGMVGGIPGSMASMGNPMGMNMGLGGFGDLNGFQNAFTGQPGFGGGAQMNMNRGGWGY